MSGQTPPSNAALVSPVAIVGAHGRMGAWHTKLLRSYGCTVSEIDCDTPEQERLAALRAARSVLISVPIAITEEVIRKVIPELQPDALLLDLTSLKAKPLAAMLEHRGEVLGLHPMCAPSEAGLLNQPVVVCRGRPGPKADGFIEILRTLGAQIREMDAQQHDKLMAVVQGLHHFYAVAFAHSFKALGLSPGETKQVSSPVYELRTQLMARILGQDPNLYVDIELENPYVPEVLRAYAQSVEQFKDAIERGSRSDCLAFFKEAVGVFGDYSRQALQQTDTLLALRQQALSASTQLRNRN
jgi:prephenate dehydrogenase